jgi:hypothetical protein
MQIVAMLTMLIDHIGYVFFSDDPIFRIIGRIAFPLYTYGIVLGLRYTSDVRRYIRRLFLLAIVSQIPFMLAFRTVALNVIFTLTVSLITIVAIDRTEDRNRKRLIFALSLVATFIIPMDYGWYGVILACIYRYLQPGRMVAGHLALNLAECLMTWNFLQLFSILPTIVIAYRPKLLHCGRRHVPAWIWRSFYPAHLSVLGIVYLAEIW